ncbi:hypothetical protein [Nocardia camponoti]|uniref:Uncharacterized protein n=1 Tax=Nocardia camponoti TaxID=1616106 RepID=A0A917QF55_9NOCA|nr:hypothetical protein [Nocardia camponoti]GGK48456.1 hypothetical protein GCM10011591_19800 [Nocardia camponoti]
MTSPTKRPAAPTANELPERPDAPDLAGLAIDEQLARDIAVRYVAALDAPGLATFLAEVHGNLDEPAAKRAGDPTTTTAEPRRAGDRSSGYPANWAV